MKPSLRAALMTVGLVAVATVAGTNLLSSPTETAVAQAAEVRPGTPGSFVAISSYRTMDNRFDGYAGEFGAKMGRTEDNFLGGISIPVYVQFELEPGGSNQIQFPDEAVAVTYNVTVTGTEGAGFVQVDGFGSADGSTSTVNWSEANQTIANSGVALLGSAFDDPGAVGVYLGGTTDAKAHVILDITGYYMPIATP